MYELEKENIAPYLSILMGVKEASHGPCDVHKRVKKLLEDSSENKITFYESKNETIGDLAQVWFTPYRISKSPSWLVGYEAMDLENHVFVTFNVNNYIGIYLSEKGKKDEIRECFGKAPLSDIFPVSIEDLNSNFINEDKIKMLWLSGIHGKSNFKADSKVLGGDSVADTLDPLIDQSYMMSAVRTESINNSKSSIGINPFKSSIWSGPCKDWKTFENKVVQILDLLANGLKKAADPISILSYPIPNCSGLADPYDFSLIDYEFYPEEDGQRRKELLKKLYFDFSVELQGTFVKSDIAIDVFYQRRKVGSVIVEPHINDYQVTFKIKSEVVINRAHLETYKKVFNYPEIIKCWFDSGHALVNGMVFKTGYQDVKFDRFIWADFEDYDLKIEKPGVPTKPDLHDIGNQKSLFCWVKNRWNGDWSDYSKFNTTEKPNGWLYCDDGAGEKADFIHLTEFEGFTVISLIHVKAAKSDSDKRRISVGAHDIVLNQGVKNLRYCMRKNLTTDLRERFEKSTSKQCWRDGKPVKAEDFLNELDKTIGSSTCRFRVVIVQPHTQKTVYTGATSSNSKRQLDVLLVSAESAIRASGAEFHIIGVDS